MKEIKSINYDKLTITDASSIITAVEEVFKTAVENQSTFNWAGGSVKRRPIMGRTFTSPIADKHSYVPFYTEMKLIIPVNKTVITGKYDSKKDVFKSEDGKTYYPEKDNAAALKKDKKEFPKNYPSHLSKK